MMIGAIRERALANSERDWKTPFSAHPPLRPAIRADSDTHCRPT